MLPLDTLLCGANWWPELPEGWRQAQVLFRPPLFVPPTRRNSDKGRGGLDLRVCGGHVSLRALPGSKSRRVVCRSVGARSQSRTEDSRRGGRMGGCTRVCWCGGAEREGGAGRDGGRGRQRELQGGTCLVATTQSPPPPPPASLSLGRHALRAYARYIVMWLQQSTSSAGVNWPLECRHKSWRGLRTWGLPNGRF